MTHVGFVGMSSVVDLYRGRRLNPDAVDGQTALERAKAFARDEQDD